MTKIPKAVSEYMRELGRKGGSVKSEAKAEAARENGKKRKGARRPKRKG